MKTVGENEYGLTVNVVDCLRPCSYVYASELDRALLCCRQGCSKDHDADNNPSDLAEVQSPVIVQNPLGRSSGHECVSR